MRNVNIGPVDDLAASADRASAGAILTNNIGGGGGSNKRLTNSIDRSGKFLITQPM